MMNREPTTSCTLHCMIIYSFIGYNDECGEWHIVDW